jgi:hypothetical protein
LPFVVIRKERLLIFVRDSGKDEELPGQSCSESGKRVFSWNDKVLADSLGEIGRLDDAEVFCPNYLQVAMVKIW